MAKDKLPPGVHDLTPATAQDKKPALPSTGFYRICIYLPGKREPGAPDHVVAARDEIEAEAICYRELGILSVDKSVNTVDITVASEADYLKAQAKRLRVDVRAETGAEGKLVWAPPGYRPQKTYYVRATGELAESSSGDPALS
jgi:hypothetical protein